MNHSAKIDSWVAEDDDQWLAARQRYDTVQDRVAMLYDIPFHLEKHQATADRIYTKWLESTEWAVA